MKKTSSRFPGAFALAAASCVLAAAAAYCEPSAPDGVLSAQVEDGLYFNPFLDGHDIRVEVKGGVARLSGTVATLIESELAEGIAGSYDGVSRVENALRVDEQAQGRGRLKFVQKVRDLTTTAAIRSKIAMSRRLSGAPIRVETANDIVTLTGVVQTGAMKAAAEELAASTHNVADVENKLRISEPRSVGERIDNVTTEITQGASDTWISTKIRSMLAFNSDFPGSRVRVTTRDGVVVLDGSVRSGAQRDLVETSVREVVGVKDVENRLIVRERG